MVPKESNQTTFYSHECIVQVEESEQQYRTKIEELERKLEHFERECNNHETVLNTTVQKNKTLIEKLQEEKAMQEVHVCSTSEISQKSMNFVHSYVHGGSSVVECLTRAGRATGSSLTGVTALWSLSKTHLS